MRGVLLRLGRGFVGGILEVWGGMGWGELAKVIRIYDGKWRVDRSERGGLFDVFASVLGISSPPSGLSPAAFSKQDF